MAIDDVTEACGVLRPVHDQAAGADGISCSSRSRPGSGPTRRTPTIDSARSLHERIKLPNLMVKIPATAAGVPAIEKMISEGRNINVTLIFSLERYGDVIEAYPLSGLRGLGLHGWRPVAESTAWRRSS